MNMIAFDTSSQALSAALETDGGVWYMEIDAGSRHSELLMDCADWLCKEAGIKSSELTHAACMKGPGSFTGLRIGFSAAKGLALALGIPLYAIPTLDCLSYPLSVWPGMVIPAIDAKKNCFFTALYRRGERLTDYIDAPAESIAKTVQMTACPNEPVIVTGSGAQLLNSRLAPCLPPGLLCVDPEFCRGRARELLELAKNAKIQKIDDINSGPVYLRKSDAELNLITE